jgi:ribosomal protein S18 acetylase RimI-like enzyme
VVLIVRRLLPEDHRLLRTLRLRSLFEAPASYGSTYEREVSFTDSDWSHRLRHDGNPHFVCSVQDTEPMGLVAVARDDADPQIAYLLGMWVNPEARGTGAADTLVDAAFAWAMTEGCVVARLHVTEGNDRAEHAYQRTGFHRTGATFVRARDGLTEIEMERLLRERP